MSDSPIASTHTQRAIQLQENTRPYQNFIQSLKSDYTKRDYKKALSRYLSHYNTTLERMLSLPIDEVEEKLVDYIIFLKKDDLSTSFINMNFCALKHFYFMNNVRINKEKIGKFVGESKKKNVDRSYFHPEIKSMLDIADQGCNFCTCIHWDPYRSFAFAQIIPFTKDR